MFCFDGTSIGICSAEVSFNLKGDKLLMCSENGILIYSITSRSVILEKYLDIDSDAFEDFEWSYDLQKRRILCRL